MGKTGKLIIFVIVVFCLGILIASFFWRDNTIYSGAYAPMVEKAQARKAAELERQKQSGEASEEPHAKGFREKDIDRQKGNGFSTY